MNILEGAWGNEQDGNALFYIEGDSIYYTERQESPYSIEIKGNTFSVDYEGYSSKSEVVKLTKDSLVYKNEDNFTTKLFRME